MDDDIDVDRALNGAFVPEGDKRKLLGAMEEYGFGVFKEFETPVDAPDAPSEDAVRIKQRANAKKLSP